MSPGHLLHALDSREVATSKTAIIQDSSTATPTQDMHMRVGNEARPKLPSRLIPTKMGASYETRPAPDHRYWEQITAYLSPICEPCRKYHVGTRGASLMHLDGDRVFSRPQIARLHQKI